jgi:hypothetical protein
MFAWAVVSAIHQHRVERSDADRRDSSHSQDAQADCMQHEHRVLQHDRNLRASLQLLSDILFADMYPRDCAITDWDLVGACGDSSAHKHAIADAACFVLLMMMDAAAWTYGVVLAADIATTSGVNFEHSLWVKSTTYRFAQLRFVYTIRQA